MRVSVMGSSQKQSTSLDKFIINRSIRLIIASFFLYRRCLLLRDPIDTNNGKTAFISLPDMRQLYTTIVTKCVLSNRTGAFYVNDIYIHRK